MLCTSLLVHYLSHLLKQYGKKSQTNNNMTKKNYLIIQDIYGVFEQGFYLVIDTKTNTLLDMFQFKIEAKQYLKQIKNK